MTDPSLPDRAQEIRARCEKATPGPWAWEATGEKSNDYSIGTAFGPNDEPIRGRILATDDPEYAEEHDILMDDHILRRHLVGDGENGNLADADFIAHARSDIPWLLDQLRAAQEEIDRLRLFLGDASPKSDALRQRLDAERAADKARITELEAALQARASSGERTEI